MLRKIALGCSTRSTWKPTWYTISSPSHGIGIMVTRLMLRVEGRGAFSNKHGINTGFITTHKGVPPFR